MPATLRPFALFVAALAVLVLTAEPAAAGPDRTGPTIVISSPTSSAVRGTVTVSGTVNDTSGVTSLEVTANGSPLLLAISGKNTQRTFTATLDTSAIADGPLVLIATAVDGKRNRSSFSLSLVSDNTAPSGMVRYPATSGSTALPLYVTAEDATSGIAGRVIERRETDLASGTCGSWTDWSAIDVPDPAFPWSAPVEHAHCYQYRITITDNAGNTHTNFIGTTARVDTTAPAVSFSTLERNGAEYQHFTTGGLDSIVYINPARSGSFDLQVTATDPESGTAAVHFPRNLGPTISLPGTSASYIADYTAPFAATYAFTAGVTQRSGGNVLVSNGITSRLYSVLSAPDATAPEPGYINVPGGWTASAKVYIQAYLLNDLTGSSAEVTSGAAGLRYERRHTRLVSGGCDAATWSTWAAPGSLVATPGTAPWHRTDSLANSGCYEYRVVAYDNVGNEATPTAMVRHVMYDAVPPKLTTDLPPSGSTVSGVLTINGTVTDFEAGGFTRTYLCIDSNPCTQLAKVAATTDPGYTWTTSFSTADHAGGWHVVTIKATDAVGRSATVTRQLLFS